LSRFSFCNINREHDAVTKFINQHFRPSVEGRLKDAAISMAFCRIFNEPETLKLACPLGDLEVAQAAIAAKQKTGVKVFRGAYIMPAHEGKGNGAVDYWFRALRDVQKLDFTGVTELGKVAEIMMTVKGFGEFVANQVCADLRYVNGLSFTDWGDFILCGPGTRRGLNRLRERPTRDHLNSSTAVEEIKALRGVLEKTNPRESAYFKDPNNVANSLCEYDKYARSFEGGQAAKLKAYGRNRTQTLL
jgi:hypothetical protein